VAAFIDISGAYDNVLIDILCDILREKEVPLQVVRFLFRQMWRKVLVFSAGGRECMTLVGYKDLPRGSVLSPFLYNIIGSCSDRFIPSGCGFHQYVDDLLVYMAHRLVNFFFSSMGLTISASKSEVILFTRKHERPPILLRIGAYYVLPQTTCFKYLGIFFDSELRWRPHVKYVRRRFLQMVILLKSMAGVFWGAHPSCLILLYK
jgi:hypothetical protein